jgi:serine/threonine-protein kinase
LVFSEGSSAVRGQDLKILSLGADRTVTPLLNSPFDELNGEISPDGQWLAYQSDESGQFEVYVRPFPDTNRWRIRVSVNGGQQPAWARKGAELFYVTSDGEVMGASVRKLADGRIEASPPAKVVDGAGYYNSEGTPNRGRTYDVAADGRFLRIKLNPSDPRVADATPRRIVAVLNWFDELKRAVPVK